MESEFEVEDEERVVRLVRVVGHLRRLQVMIVMHERGMASASVLSKAGLGENADAAYHLCKLARLGAAEVAHTKHGSRGSPQRFYKLTAFGLEALRTAAVLGRKT